jgi:hypothetical protein
MKALDNTLKATKTDEKGNKTEIRFNLRLS